MVTYRTKGIIIKKIDYGEADRILTIFTSGLGKISAIAKGVRKTTSKMGGYLELFNVVDLMLAEGKNLEIVTSVKTINNFTNLCGSLNKTCKAYYIIELLDKLTPDEYKDTRVFNLCVKTLMVLNEKNINNSLQENLVIQSSKLKLLVLLGFSPRLDKCLNCGSKAKQNSAYYFSNVFNGVICVKCISFDRSAVKLNANQFKILRILNSNDFNLILRLDIQEKDIKYISEILDSYIKFIIEKDIKSINFMRKVDNLK